MIEKPGNQNPVDEKPDPVGALKELIKTVKGEEAGQEIIDYAERQKDYDVLPTQAPKTKEGKEHLRKVREVKISERNRREAEILAKRDGLKD